MDDQAVYRILDANANRAGEGLRTIEEAARFVWQDRPLTERCKELRHALAAAVQLLDAKRLLAARDTPGDPGCELTNEAETKRDDRVAVWQAAFKRLEQSLRCLEEYGKLISAEFAGRVERVRYQTYTLEKDFILQKWGRSWIAGARLYVLVDLQGEDDVWSERIRAASHAGVDVIQLRDKGASDLQLLRRAESAMGVLSSLPLQHRSRLVINDRADIAAAVEADGVHVGQDELTVAAVRRVLRDDQVVGVSTHDLEQARRAVEEGADYIGCGPTFPSQTKRFEQFAGLEFLRQVAGEITVPAFAIGGINAENVRQVAAVGMRRIAVSQAVWGQPPDQLAEVCNRLKQALEGESTEVVSS